MPFLFDTDALSESLRRKPLRMYIEWLVQIPRAEQFTSAVAIGELCKGAFRSSKRDKHIRNIEGRVLPAVTTLPYDVATARAYGEISATLELAGQRLPDADVQIAGTALYHDLELVTGNIRHFERIPGLRINSILARAREQEHQ